MPVALVPLVMVAMNLTYAASAYPFGKLSDRMSHKKLLALGLVILIAADMVLASNDHWGVVLAGVALWGMHMGITLGLLAAMVADTAPADLRGTAYGFFNLMSGIAMLVASGIAALVAGWRWFFYVVTISPEHVAPSDCRIFTMISLLTKVFSPGQATVT